MTATSASIRSRYSTYSVDVLARGLQERDEGDVLAELGVLVEEEVEGREAAQHVLREVGAVDAQDQVLAAAAQQLASPPPPTRCDSAAARSASGSIETG